MGVLDRLRERLSGLLGSSADGGAEPETGDAFECRICGTPVESADGECSLCGASDPVPAGGGTDADGPGTEGATGDGSAAGAAATAAGDDRGPDGDEPADRGSGPDSGPRVERVGSTTDDDSDRLRDVRVRGILERNDDAWERVPEGIRVELPDGERVVDSEREAARLFEDGR